MKIMYFSISINLNEAGTNENNKCWGEIMLIDCRRTQKWAIFIHHPIRQHLASVKQHSLFPHKNDPSFPGQFEYILNWFYGIFEAFDMSSGLFAAQRMLKLNTFQVAFFWEGLLFSYCGNNEYSMYQSYKLRDVWFSWWWQQWFKWNMTYLFLTYPILIRFVRWVERWFISIRWCKRRVETEWKLFEERLDEAHKIKQIHVKTGNEKKFLCHELNTINRRTVRDIYLSASEGQ